MRIDIFPRTHCSMGGTLGQVHVIAHLLEENAPQVSRTIKAIEINPSELMHVKTTVYGAFVPEGLSS